MLISIFLMSCGAFKLRSVLRDVSLDGKYVRKNVAFKGMKALGTIYKSQEMVLLC